MRGTHLLGAALLLSVPLLAGQAAAAGPAAPQMTWARTIASTAADASVVERAGWQRCERWASKCAWRWGAGTWRYDRCMRRHGC